MRSGGSGRALAGARKLSGKGDGFFDGMGDDSRVERAHGVRVDGRAGGRRGDVDSCGSQRGERTQHGGPVLVAERSEDERDVLGSERERAHVARERFGAVRVVSAVEQEIADSLEAARPVYRRDALVDGGRGGADARTERSGDARVVPLVGAGQADASGQGEAVLLDAERRRAVRPGDLVNRSAHLGHHRRRGRSRGPASRFPPSRARSRPASSPADRCGRAQCG